MSDAVLIAENLAAGYGKRVIQRDLNFRIARGEVFVIMGGSGCGKSTLLRHLIGLQAPLAGRMLFNGEEFWAQSEARRAELQQEFGVLYQNGALWGSMTLRENICLPLETYRPNLGRAELDELYGEIVKNLNAQARVMGYHDYSELSYVRMNRIGYGPEEIRKFRDQVANDVVPQLQKVMAMRAKRTGIARPTFTDLPIMFKDGNPKPIPGYKARMDAARTMYHELSPETAEFIDFMQDNELFDVESRPGKMSGGYMTSLPSYKAPFIFANWNNTSGDVDVLTHECGHAFEGYVAERDPEVPADLECPGMESAEIHSMAMEFLTAPWHHLLFGRDTDKYALLHAEDSFVFLAYGCEVDEFQHIMYQNPDLTPDERNAEWLKLEKKYRPWIDFAGLPFYGRGAGWQRQLHIYECPFYYIDYCLSTMAALQFFLLSLTDHKDAWQRYLRLVRRAGMASYTELLETAGLKVPFEEGSIKGIAQQMTDWLETHQV
jgi:M3 family oligoendopeptidase